VSTALVAARPAAPGGSRQPQPQQRQVSVAELQAALVAAQRGDFAAAAWGGHRSAHSSRATGPGATAESAWRLGWSTVTVLAGHAGAGASTVALAIAEAASTAGTRVELVDCADPGRSGLAGVSTAELGGDSLGWRRARRGHIQVDRLTDRIEALTDVPTPRLVAGSEPAGAGLLVIDLGWPATATISTPGWISELIANEPIVVVCRVSVPGVQQTDQLLAELPRPAIVAAVGPRRWPGVVNASCGAGLRAAQASGRIVTVPTVGPLAVTGLTADPLPRPLAVAGRELTALIHRLTPARAGLVDETETKDLSC